MDQNDWNCCCGEHNFGRNDACRKCGPGPARPAPAHQVMRQGDWRCVCTEHNFGRNATCRKCGGPRPGPATAQIPMKPGDWECPCGEHNFGRNIVCRKCRTPRPGAQVTMKPGDWRCSCTEHNFGRNATCRKCGNPRPGPATAQVTMKPGDWECPCGEHNFGRNIVCRKCRNAKLPQPSAPTPGEIAPTARTGYNWNCRKCNESNFGRNPSCRRCGDARPNRDGHTMEVVPKRPGDWNCEECAKLNTSEENTCKACQTEKGYRLEEVTGDEKEKLLGLFATVKRSAVVKIEAVHNSSLRAKLGSDTWSEWFYSCQLTKPEVICRQGFDKNFFASTSWGAASHFTSTAAGVADSAYSTSEGTQQIFLADVSAGKLSSAGAPGAPSLETVSSQSTLHAAVPPSDLRHETVEKDGHFYLVYGNYRSCPKYLITFTVTPEN